MIKVLNKNHVLVKGDRIRVKFDVDDCKHAKEGMTGTVSKILPCPYNKTCIRDSYPECPGYVEIHLTKDNDGNPINQRTGSCFGYNKGYALEVI